MFPRSLRNEFRYFRYKRSKPTGCAFCHIDTGSSSQVITVHTHTTVLKNLFPYSRWDGRAVVDHRMVIPIDHITSLTRLSAGAATELLRIVADYEEKGYSFYIRSPHNKSRSVPHVHGHLIKLR